MRAINDSLEYDAVNENGEELLDLRYADDTALLSVSTTGMDNLIYSVRKHSEENGLLLNVKKN